MENSWTKSERSIYLIAYGLMASAIALYAVAALIEACRSRPKLQVLAFGFKKPDDKREVVKQPAKPGPDESSSAAE